MATRLPVDDLIASLKDQLDLPELRAVLEGAGFSRRVDITLTATMYVDRGRTPKPPRFVIS